MESKRSELKQEVYIKSALKALELQGKKDIGRDRMRIIVRDVLEHIATDYELWPFDTVRMLFLCNHNGHHAADPEPIEVKLEEVPLP